MNLKTDKLFIQFTVLFYVVNIYLFFSLPSYDIFLSGYVYLKFLYAYLSIKIIGYNFFENVVKIAYYGTIISFPFFILQLLNYDLTFDLVGLLQNNLDFLSFRNDSYANNFLFTVNGAAQYRNSGFMWEPKGFSNFLILAIFFRLILNGIKLIDKKILILMLGVISTFSTAGIISLFFIIIFYFLNKNIKIMITVFPVFLIVFSLIFFNSKILYEKIIYELSLQQEYQTLLEKNDYEKETYSLGRTGSFIVDFNDFLERPILGYGYTRENRTNSIYVKLIRVNGFSDLLVVYGGIGLLIYFYRHYLFLKILKQKLGYKYFFVIFIMFIGIYFATTLTLHPLWMSLIFLTCIIKDRNLINDV
tara:strand:+ start:957 stop:2039 length:1083 start_codon:yes stop_codon:yes gene_type:complete